MSPDKQVPLLRPVDTRRCIASHDPAGLELPRTGVGMIAITNVENALHQY